MQKTAESLPQILRTNTVYSAKCINFLGLKFMKSHKLSGFNNRNLLSHLSGAKMSAIKAPTGLVSSEGCEEESVL